MHAVIVHLTPILGAEKSKTPFYIAGGALVVWALAISLGLGLRSEGFPRSAATQRALMGVTAVLVAVAASMAVATSGGSTKEAQASSAAGTGSAASGGTGGTAPGPSSSTAPSGGAGASGGTAAPSGGASTLAQEADPTGQLRFVKQTLAAGAGKLSISFTNRSPLSHNLTISSGSKVLGATPTFDGGAKTLTLNLKPGTYKFFCSVPGHREAGMEGTLVVR